MVPSARLSVNVSAADSAAVLAEGDEDVLAEVSVLLDPALTAEQKILARCSRKSELNFQELYPDKVLLQTKKVQK